MNAYDIFNKLTASQLELIQSVEDGPKVFKYIANQLFNHFYIQKGKIRYRFLEIEFYYHAPHHMDLKDNGQPFVYEREYAVSGTLFKHSSGVDLCFRSETTLDKYGNKYMKSGGGILIRNLLRVEEGEKTLVAGPWDCGDALCNYAYTGNFAELQYVEDAFEIEPVQTVRYHVPERTKDWPYCFYDPAIAFIR